MLESFSDKPLITVVSPWSPPSFYSRPTFWHGGEARKEWLWKCSLTRLLCSLCKAHSFLVSRLSHLVIRPPGKRAPILMNWPVLPTGHPRWRLAALCGGFSILRCVGKTQIWRNNFMDSLSWILGETDVYPMMKCRASYTHGRFLPFIITIEEKKFFCKSNSQFALNVITVL